MTPDRLTVSQHVASDHLVDPASRVLVTGCAGFIGSHVSERLVAGGCEVLGVDCFTDYYDRDVKEENLDGLMSTPGFGFSTVDLSEDDISGLLDDVTHVIHLAGQPGVRLSFGGGFPAYLRHNVLATQRLLEEAVANPVDRFVYASSSSVYGDAPSYPTHEASVKRPVSPYGMTKLATEELAAVYHRNFGVPVVGLRYFTVYGPRQRPDMAFTKFLRRAVGGLPLPLFGSGRQVRDFTYVDDIVDGTVAAAERGRPGGVYNLGGGEPVELRRALELISELLGHEIVVDSGTHGLGDVRRTGCDGQLARAELDFRPRVGLRQGLASHLAWVINAAAPARVGVAS